MQPWVKRKNITFDKLVETILVERTIDVLTVLLSLGLTLLVGGTETGSFPRRTCYASRRKTLVFFRIATVITVIVLFLAVTAVVMFFMLRKRLSAHPVFGRVYSFPTAWFQP